MKKRKPFIGGEDFSLSEVMPKDFDKFFGKRLLYLILAILFLLVVVLIW